MSKNKIHFFIINITILLFILSIQTSAIAQSVTLTNQDEVDAFDPTITTIGGVFQSGGDLTIGSFTDSTDIVDISNLSNISTINGALKIVNTQLENLDDLSNLNFEIARLQVGRNSKLTNINGLSQLVMIEDNISITENDKLENLDGFSGLSSIGGDVSISRNSSLTNLDGFSGITFFKDISLLDNDLLSSIDGLSSITFIEENLIIGDNDTLENIDGLLNLTTAPNIIIIRNNRNLNSVDGLTLQSINRLDIVGNSSLINLDGLTNLDSIRSIYIISNQDLENIDGIMNISSATNGISISHNQVLSSIPSFPNLNYVGGSITISSNDNLLNLGFTSIDSTYNSIEIRENNSLIDFNGFTNLKSVANVNNFPIGQDLNIISNPLLENLDGLSNLEKINFGFTIRNNHSLNSLMGLLNVSYINSLEISENDVLTNLSGLNPDAIESELLITDNQRLSNCCSIYELLTTSGVINSAVSIFNNPSPCGSVQEIIQDACYFNPGNNNHQLIGTTNIDINNNGCDTLDPVWSYLRFDIEDNQGNNLSVYGNDLGNHNIGFPEGTFKLTPQVEFENTFMVLPETVDLTFPTTTNLVQQNFCATPLVDTTIVNLDIIPLDEARPGFDSSYKIILSNAGTIPLGGKVNFSFPISMEFLTFSDVTTAENTGSICWTLDNLLPIESKVYFIHFNLNSPTEEPPLNIGEILNLDLEFEIANGQDNLLFNTSIAHPVINAFDPNDKQCLEGESLILNQIGEYLHYMIRFENIGTASAINVAISDTIDTNSYDISTLEVTDSSHPMESRITNGNIVEFIFREINLPFQVDSNDGFVVFKIKTNSNLTPGDLISNDADIYFDYNPPIKTNNAISIFEEPSSILELSEFDITIYPNPTKDILYIKTESRKNLDFNLYNVLGQQQVFSRNESSINLSSLIAGTYLLKVSDKVTKNFMIKKFVIVK